MSVNPESLRALQHENITLKDENRSLRHELARLRQAVRSLKDLQDSLALISTETDVFALLKSILLRALEAVNSENGSLLLLDEETGELVFAEVQGPYQEVLMGYRLPQGAGIAGWVVANRTPELVADVRLEPRFYSVVDQTTGFRTSSIVCAPLIHEDRVWGVLEAVNTLSGDPFSEEDLDILMLVAQLAAQAVALADQVMTTSEE